MNWNGVMSRLERVGLMQWMPTNMFLKQKFRRLTGKKLDLRNPNTFNEKLQWLKVWYVKHMPDYVPIMVDKITAKDYVANLIGSEHIIPTIKVWNNVETIDLNELPNSFVLKCNHDSGGVIVCRDKSNFDINSAKKKLTKNLKRNFYWYGREPQYKYIKPRVFAEEFIEDGVHQDIPDFKLYCFNGQVRMIQVCNDRKQTSGMTEDFFDTDWKLLPISRVRCGKSKISIPKPEKLDEMISYACIISKNLPHARIDFYAVKGNVFFGEVTMFSASGFKDWEPDDWNIKMGEWLELPQNR